MKRTTVRAITVLLAVSLAAALALCGCGNKKETPQGTTADAAASVATFTAAVVPTSAEEGTTSADAVTGAAVTSAQTDATSTAASATAANETTAAAAATTAHIPALTENTPSTAASATTAQPAAPATEAPATSAREQTPSGSQTSTSAADGVFTERDLAQTVDLSSAASVQVSDGSGYTISEAGVYVFSGTASGYTVTVAAPADAKVQIVLNGVNITNADFPAIYVKTADKVFVTTSAPSSLTVTGTFKADGSVKTDAVIFSKQDLSMNGTSSLSIVSRSGNGITCKDDFKATGGAYTIDAGKHGIQANDSVSIGGGSYNINAGTDGIHCVNNDDNTKGSVYFSGGDFVIKASSDGVEALSTLTVDGGTLKITGSEGLEATQITINAGTIDISASDDGINASQKSSAFSVVITINGGDLTIVMGAGDTDAVDANGSIYVNGGTINITAPTSAFDYDVSGQINGGTVYVNGEQITVMTNQMMGGPGGMGGPGFPGGRGGFGG